MPTADQLQDATVAALTAKAGVGDNVFSPRTWRTVVEDEPILLVQSPKERKESLGRDAPQFTTTVTIRVVGRLRRKSSGDDDRTGAAVLVALGVLQRQVERAVINDYDLYRLIQQVAHVDVVSDVKSEGGYVHGELVMDFGLETYQGPEEFGEVEADEIVNIATFLDLVNVFSPDGAFDETPFPDSVTPFPRTAGPDGRLEGLFIWGAPADLDFSDPNNSGLLPGV